MQSLVRVSNYYIIINIYIDIDEDKIWKGLVIVIWRHSQLVLQQHQGVA